MKPTIKSLFLGLLLIYIPLSVGRALHEAPSALAAGSQSHSLGRRGPVIITSGGKGGSGKGGGKAGGGGKGGTPGDDDGAPAGSEVKDKPIDYEDFLKNYEVTESPTMINERTKPEDKPENIPGDKPEDRGSSPKSLGSTGSTDLIDLGSRLNIQTELSQPFTAIRVTGGSRAIDGAIMEINIPAKDTLTPGQKTVVIGETQIAIRDYHRYEDDPREGIFKTERVTPLPGYRSQTDIQATILIQNELKPDIVIRRAVINTDTQLIIKEAVENFGQGSNHATLKPGSGEPGMTELFHRALVSDNLRSTVQGMERYPTYFEGRFPTQVDVVWVADDPESSVISVSFEKK